MKWNVYESKSENISDKEYSNSNNNKTNRETEHFKRQTPFIIPMVDG